MAAEMERPAGGGRISIAATFGIVYLFLALCSLLDARGIGLPAPEASAGLLLALGALGLITVFRRVGVGKKGRL